MLINVGETDPKTLVTNKLIQELTVEAGSKPLNFGKTFFQNGVCWPKELVNDAMFCGNM